MLGSTRRVRWTAWIGAFAAVAVVIALVSPEISGAGATPGVTTERDNRVALTAARAVPPPPAPLARAVELRFIVTPDGGADLGVFDVPGAPAPSQVLPAFNELGYPLVLLAVEQRQDWYRVMLPTRPNGSSAWVPVSAVTASSALYGVQVSLSALQLQVVRIADKAVVLTSPIGRGAPASPTPTGLFFVREHFPTSGANHPYGPMALGLSGHSEVHMQFGTGDGRIAIHGTNQPSSIGGAVSNGCVHVPNDVVLQLVPFMPPGTPVTIAA